MSDLAAESGYQLDRARLEQELGVPGRRNRCSGHDGVRLLVDSWRRLPAPGVRGPSPGASRLSTRIQRTQRDVRRILQAIGYQEPCASRRSCVSMRSSCTGARPAIWRRSSSSCSRRLQLGRRADGPHRWRRGRAGYVAQQSLRMARCAPAGRRRRRGVGKRARVPAADPDPVLFILALEDSGYLRARAYLLDRLMGRRSLRSRVHSAAVELCLAVRHHGDAHHPEPARPHGDDHDRAADDVLGPAAVYALVIAHSFRPSPWARSTCRASCCSRCTSRASSLPWRWRSCSSARHSRPRITRCCSNCPIPLAAPQQLAIGLWERTKVFLQRVGTIILALMIVLWFLSTYPAPPPGWRSPAIAHQLRRHDRDERSKSCSRQSASTGRFRWRWSPARAREVAVGALARVLALETMATSPGRWCR